MATDSTDTDADPGVTSPLPSPKSGPISSSFRSTPTAGRPRWRRRTNSIGHSSGRCAGVSTRRFAERTDTTVGRPRGTTDGADRRADADGGAGRC
ncbi:hypothetical protein BRD01_02900 [Halobacteriales archaeon QS_8_65_32]|nr:MAG: hypothetical protein BRD01_02900 [Halobacteriales archaeon QS_8_65_32]